MRDKPIGFDNSLIFPMDRATINTLTDQQIVNGLIQNDKHIIEYFFCKKCSKLFSYITYSVYSGTTNVNELVNELYLYIAADNWKKLRQFDYRSKLMTWIGVVAIRFFKKKRERLIENNSNEAQIEHTMNLKSYSMPIDDIIDVRQALNRMPNMRYRMVIQQLDLYEVEPEKLAKEMNITVANLYNIHRRALQQLKVVMLGKEVFNG